MNGEQVVTKAPEKGIVTKFSHMPSLLFPLPRAYMTVTQDQDVVVVDSLRPSVILFPSRNDEQRKIEFVIHFGETRAKSENVWRESQFD